MFYINIVLSVCMSLILFHPPEPVPTLQTESGTNTQQGVVRLSWIPVTDEGEQVYELQQSSRSDFSDAIAVYTGGDRGTFISGLENGTYHFRLRTNQGPWSESLLIQIEHHPLNLALILMGLGVAVFASVLLVLFRATKNR